MKWTELPLGFFWTVAAFVAGIAVLALKQKIGESFITKDQFKSLVDTVTVRLDKIDVLAEKYVGEYRAAGERLVVRLEEIENKFSNALRQQEREITLHLEKHYATVAQLNGLGERVTETDRRVAAAIDTFARGQDQVLDRANQAEDRARNAESKVERTVVLVEERLRALDEMKKSIDRLAGEVSALATDVRTLSGRKP